MIAGPLVHATLRAFTLQTSIITMTKRRAEEQSRNDRSFTKNLLYAAHCEASVMSGTGDRSISCNRQVFNKQDRDDEKLYECVGRLRRLPVLESAGSMLSNFYANVRQSRCMVQTMFKNVEDGFSRGAVVVSPVTEKIGDSLERPLKTMDNVIRTGLDFLEERVPVVKLPPVEIYEKSKDFVNDNIFTPTLHFGYGVLGNVKEQVSRYKNQPGHEAGGGDDNNHCEDDITTNERS